MSKRSAQTQRKMKLARRAKKAEPRPIRATAPKLVGPPQGVGRKWSLAELELHEVAKPRYL